MSLYKEEPLVTTAYEICRWHHERYDGKGYPDGLAGDSIPISAQIVALADVYDALTSERCYKPGYPHKKAVRMIVDGECGQFNPLLLECFQDIQDELKKEISVDACVHNKERSISHVASQMRSHEELSESSRMLRQLEIEKKKSEFYAAEVPEIVLVYQTIPPALKFAKEGAAKLGVPETVFDPFNMIPQNSPLRVLLERMDQSARRTIAEQPYFHLTGRIRVDGEERMCCFNCQAIWVSADHTGYAGFIGKITDIQRKEERHAEEENIADAPGRMRGKYEMTGQELWALIRQLDGMHDRMRLVDASSRTVFSVDRKGNIIPVQGCCYSVWKKGEACSNCISERVLSTKFRQAKYEVLDDEMYYITAVYLEVDGYPYALEMINQVSDVPIPSEYYKEEKNDEFKRVL